MNTTAGSVGVGPGSAGPIVLSRRVDPSAVAALFRMTVARLVRGRRLIVLAFLFALPSGFALLGQRYDPNYEPDQVELALIFALIPQTLLPITALVFASGMIQDEVEEQTLTYLLIRPLPRPAIYLTKLAATLAVTAALASAFTFLTFAVVHEFASDEPAETFLWRPLKTTAGMLLALAAYGSLFALVSLFIRRALVVGVAYIIVAEGLLANIDFMVRKLTIMYQLRVLTIRWLELRADVWAIDLSVAPSATWAALNLAIAAAVLALAGGWLFARLEFRVKTPEGT